MVQWDPLENLGVWANRDPLDSLELLEEKEIWDLQEIRVVLVFRALVESLENLEFLESPEKWDLQVKMEPTVRKEAPDLLEHPDLQASPAQEVNLVSTEVLDLWDKRD